MNGRGESAVASGGGVCYDCSERSGAGAGGKEEGLMELLDQTYNQKLAQALTGRRLRRDRMPEAHRGRPMLAFWGEDAGIPPGDVHHHRAYRVYLDYGTDRIITGVQVVVEGELISPCSGYMPEALDAFDYEPVLAWCLAHTEED